MSINHNILVLYWGKRGGGALYSLKIAEELSKRKDTTLFLSLSSFCELTDQFKKLNAETFTIRTYINSVGFMCMFLFRKHLIRRGLIKFIAEHRIDVVLIGMDFFWGDLIGSATKKVGAKSIYVVHEPKPHPNEPRLMAWIKKKSIKKAIKSINHFVTLTTHVKDYLLKTYNLHNDKATVIPHGIFSYSKREEPKIIELNKPIIILFFGRIDYYKGLDILIESVKILEDKWPNLQLEIWGNGDLSPYEDSLSKLSKVRIESRWIDEHEIPQIFERCDICSLPYRDASQSGIAGIASQAGVPIVACPSTGLNEQLRNTGVVFSKQINPISYSNAIEVLLNDPNLYYQLSKKSLNYAKSVSWEKITDLFIQVKKKL